MRIMLGRGAPWELAWSEVLNYAAAVWLVGKTDTELR
jgi:hypothetical protein